MQIFCILAILDENMNIFDENANILYSCHSWWKYEYLWWKCKSLVFLPFLMEIWIFLMKMQIFCILAILYENMNIFDENANILYSCHESCGGGRWVAAPEGISRLKKIIEWEKKIYMWVKFLRACRAWCWCHIFGFSETVSYLIILFYKKPKTGKNKPCLNYRFIYEIAKEKNR